VAGMGSGGADTAYWYAFVGTETYCCIVAKSQKCSEKSRIFDKNVENI